MVGAALRRSLTGAAMLTALCAPAAADPPASVTTYHGDAARSGHYDAPGLTWAAAAHLTSDPHFDGHVAGHVYAQPLFWQPPGGGTGVLVIATEDNIVVALDPARGTPVWQTRLGAPAPSISLPCSNIDPLGITGTPVIDPARGAVFLDAMVDGPHGPRHQMAGLRLADGALLPGWPLDVGVALAAVGVRFVARDQNQRAALALLGDRVFVGFGGHAGDCGDYHGMVVGFATASPHVGAAWVTRGRKGGVWSPGGISAADGSIYFTTGNTDRAARDRWDDGNGAFRMSPTLPHSGDPHDFFAPSDYTALSDQDLDLGGTMPLPIDLPGGERRLVAMGKDGNVYLLDRDNLGGVGGMLATRHVSDGNIIQAPVVYRSGGKLLVAFRAPFGLCPDGSRGTAVMALSVTAADLRPVWCAPISGRGIPIVTTAGPEAEPIVWVPGAEGDERLHGYRGDTGVPVYASQPLPGLRHFVTPMVAAGRIFLAGDGRIFAFRWDATE